MKDFNIDIFSAFEMSMLLYAWASVGVQALFCSLGLISIMTNLTSFMIHGYNYDTEGLLVPQFDNFNALMDTFVPYMSLWENRDMFHMGWAINHHSPVIEYIPVVRYNILSTIIYLEDNVFSYELAGVSSFLPINVPLEFWNLFLSLIKFIHLGAIFNITGLEMLELVWTLVSAQGPNSSNLFYDLPELGISLDILDTLDINLVDILICSYHIESIRFLFDTYNWNVNYFTNPVALYRIHPFLFQIYLFAAGLDTSNLICSWSDELEWYLFYL